MSEGKKWYFSKTIWVNILTLIGSILIAQGFDPERWAEISVGFLAIANVILRLVTNEPIDWGPTKAKDGLHSS